MKGQHDKSKMNLKKCKIKLSTEKLNVNFFCQPYIWKDTKRQEQRDKIKDQRTKNKEQRLKNKEQRTKIKEPRSKRQEQRTKIKDQTPNIEQFLFKTVRFAT